MEAFIPRNRPRDRCCVPGVWHRRLLRSTAWSTRCLWGRIHVRPRIAIAADASAHHNAGAAADAVRRNIEITAVISDR